MFPRRTRLRITNYCRRMTAGIEKISSGAEGRSSDVAPCEGSLYEFCIQGRSIVQLFPFPSAVKSWD